MDGIFCLTKTTKTIPVHLPHYDCNAISLASPQGYEYIYFHGFTVKETGDARKPEKGAREVNNFGNFCNWVSFTWPVADMLVEVTE